MLRIIRRNTMFPNLVDEFFGRDLLSNFFDTQAGISMPSVNIVEGKEDFQIEIAAPGYEKEDFTLDLTNNVLTISSEKQGTSEEKDANYMRREFNYSTFKRAFALPNSVESNKISARYKDGILYIVIPKKEESKDKPARQIKIS